MCSTFHFYVDIYQTRPMSLIISFVRVGEELTYKEQPVQILNHKDKVLCNKVIPLVKVFRSNNVEIEAT